MSGELKGTIQAFEAGGVSNVTPDAKRKRSLYEVEVVRRTDFSCDGG